jgi:hypothetical protein
MHGLPKQYNHRGCWHQQLNIHYRMPAISRNKQYINGHWHKHWYWHWH